MRKILTALLLSASVISAEARKRPIELKTFAGYDWNYTSGHDGSLATVGCFPVNDWFDLRIGATAATENSYSADGRAIVRFPMKTGNLTLENRIVYQAVVRNLTHHLCTALSAGYSRDHITASLGGYSRLYGPMNRSGNSNNVEFIIEPFNLLWSIEGRLRKDSDKWNLGIRASNFDDFHIERDNQPIVTILAHYRTSENVRLFTEAYCEPAGMFHMAADFYKAGIRSESTT